MLMLKSMILNQIYTRLILSLLKNKLKKINIKLNTGDYLIFLPFTVNIKR